LIQLQVNRLVKDSSIYPRTQLNLAHVSELAEKLRAGAVLPPVIANRQTLQLVDGFHRVEAYISVFGGDYLIQVDDREYASERDMYSDALSLNTRHGLGIVGAELISAIIKAQNFGFTNLEISRCLSITQTRVETLIRTRVATISQVQPAHVQFAPARTQTGALQAVKRSVSHLGGRTITQNQANAMVKLPGISQRLLFEQVRLIVENNMVNSENASIISELRKLKSALDEYFANSQLQDQLQVV